MIMYAGFSPPEFVVKLRGLHTISVSASIFPALRKLVTWLKSGTAELS